MSAFDVLGPKAPAVKRVAFASRCKWV